VHGVAVLRVALTLPATACMGDDEDASVRRRRPRRPRARCRRRTSPPRRPASPGRQYVYEIEARSADASSDRIPATAETPVPPLRAARLAGAFNVRTRTLSQSGYVSYQAPVFGWSFKPRCRTGACEARWSDLHRKRIRTTLERRGARYRGSYTGPFTTHCAGTPATSSVEIEFKVVAARVIGREWRATRIVGTLDQSEPVQLGCTSSGASHSLRARLVR